MMHTKLSTTAVALCATIAWATPAAAHDSWIQPSVFRSEPGELVRVQVLIGHHDHADPMTRMPARIARFEAFASPGPGRPILGREGHAPAGMLRPEEAGWHTLVYVTNPTRLDLPAERFESYLLEEGLGRVIDERARRGESSRAGRESYSRCSKALLRVGEGAEGFDRWIGLPYELTLTSDPGAWRVGSDLVFELRAEGRPATSRRVDVHELADPHRVFTLHSDEQGRVRFRAPHAGPWMLASVDMRAIPREEAGDARGDWESFWATLSFDLAAARREP